MAGGFFNAIGDAWGAVVDGSVDAVGYVSDSIAEANVRNDQERAETLAGVAAAKEAAQAIASAPSKVAAALTWLPAVATVAGVLAAAVGVAYVVRSFK